MSESSTAPISAAYHPPAGAYDEFSVEGAARNHWRFMDEVLSDPHGQWAEDQDASIRRLLNDLDAAGLTMSDLQTQQSSLEEIFVDLVQEDEA